MLHILPQNGECGRAVRKNTVLGNRIPAHSLQFRTLCRSALVEFLNLG